MKRRRIIIFLDIDGVVLPFPADPKLHIPRGRIFPNETLAALSLILEAFPKQKISIAGSKSEASSTDHINREATDTEVDIVLSSTWRVQKSMRNDIISDFHAYAVGPLSTFGDDFYDITDPKLHTERQHEIYDWLQRHQLDGTSNESLAWVALDDEELLHGPTNARLKCIFDGHVVHCDSKRGLSREQAVEAIQLLRHQLDVAEPHEL
jgi:HAD domain in Swiss Army Knife RNA repair proteins